MILTQIAACSANNIIGTEGDLPWNLPEDMKFFRDTTKGHIMIMGRKTFDSFKGRALPHRYHIVISRKAAELSFHSSENAPVIFVKSIEDAIAEATKQTAKWGQEVFVIGGGEIYKQSLPFCHKIFLTRIHQNFSGDTYFPEIDEQVFTLTDRKDRTEPIPFSFLTYVRK